MARCFSGKSDKGIVRKGNQDSFFCDPDARFFIVADGMGGHAGGEEASRIATETIREHLDKFWEESTPSNQLLETAFKKANAKILQDQKDNPVRADMGTTAVVVMFRAEQFWCGHVGDSRLYKLSDGELIQITEDHTWVARAYKNGELTLDQSKHHPWRHVLSQCLGREDLYNIDILGPNFKVEGGITSKRNENEDLFVHIKPGDRLLMCSDGLTEEVADTQILDILSPDGAECDAIATDLIEAAKTNGGSDNITVIIVEEQA
jgi:protein phosphatase